MPCFDDFHTSTVVSAPLSLCAAAFHDRMTTKPDHRPKPTGHVLRDSAHADPEHVWGDEGPIVD